MAVWVASGPTSWSSRIVVINDPARSAASVPYSDCVLESSTSVTLDIGCSPMAVEPARRGVIPRVLKSAQCQELGGKAGHDD